MTNSPRPRAVLYVDGFNLYYRALRGTPHKWLNLHHMARLLYKTFDVVGVHYFSAPVSARPQDPQQPIRQELYFRALRTEPAISITLGSFLVSTPTMMRYPPTVPPQFVQVVKTEEKGSDVNLATQLLCDAFDDLFDVAVLLTNDSDLVTPVQVARRKFGKRVFLLAPGQHISFELKNNTDEVRRLRSGLLHAAQFPPTLTDANGTFHKPPGW